MTRSDFSFTRVSALTLLTLAAVPADASSNSPYFELGFKSHSKVNQAFLSHDAMNLFGEMSFGRLFAEVSYTSGDNYSDLHIGGEYTFDAGDALDIIGKIGFSNTSFENYAYDSGTFILGVEANYWLSNSTILKAGLDGSNQEGEINTDLFFSAEYSPGYETQLTATLNFNNSSYFTRTKRTSIGADLEHFLTPALQLSTGITYYLPGDYTSAFSYFIGSDYYLSDNFVLDASLYFYNPDNSDSSVTSSVGGRLLF